MRAHPWKHHVAVVDLTEDVLQVPSTPARGVGRLAEGEPRHLEHVAKPLGRDPHVVLGPDLPPKRPRGEARHFVEPHLDDAGGVLAEGTARVELSDLTCPHAGTLRTLSMSSSRLSDNEFRCARSTSGASSRFASSCSVRRLAISEPIPLRSGIGTCALNAVRVAIATSRSRRSPSPSARRLTSVRTSP